MTVGTGESRPRLPPTTWRFVTFMAALVAAILLLRSGVLGLEWTPEALQRRAAAAGWAGPLLFVGGFALLTNILFPTSIMMVAAGMAFGWSTAIMIAIPASLLAYALGYALSVYFARKAVRGLLERMGWLHLLEGLERWPALRVSFTARYVPIPVGAQSYLLGLARLPLVPYLLGSLAGSLPWLFIFAQLGSSAGARLRTPFWLGLAAYFLLVLVTDRWWHRRKAKLSP